MRKILLLLFATVLLQGCGKDPDSDSSGTVDMQSKVVTMARSAELGMVEYTVVKVIKANDVPDIMKLKIGDRKILFRCKATLKAGFDMSGFSDADVEIDQQQKSIKITLPAPKLLNIEIKPDDISLLYENETWFRDRFSAAERNSLLAQGENDIRGSVGKMGILDDAKKSATLYFETVLRDMGYKTVNVDFRH